MDANALRSGVNRRRVAEVVAPNRRGQARAQEHRLEVAVHAVAPVERPAERRCEGKVEVGPSQRERLAGAQVRADPQQEECLEPDRRRLGSERPRGSAPTPHGVSLAGRPARGSPSR